MSDLVVEILILFLKYYAAKFSVKYLEKYGRRAGSI